MYQINYLLTTQLLYKVLQVCCIFVIKFTIQIDKFNTLKHFWSEGSPAYMADTLTTELLTTLGEMSAGTTYNWWLLSLTAGPTQVVSSASESEEITECHFLTSR